MPLAAVALYTKANGATAVSAYAEFTQATCHLQSHSRAAAVPGPGHRRYDEAMAVLLSAVAVTVLLPQ
jgi:hypothetical protein